MSENNFPKITICSLVRNREWILNHFLKNVHEIDYPKEHIDLLFIVNNSTDQSHDMLKTFKKSYAEEYNQIKIVNKSVLNLPEDERKNLVRVNHIYTHLANLRNFAMTQAETEKFMFIDSDILVPKNIIKNLLSHDKEAISSLIWNGYELFPNTPWKYPNIMKLKRNGVNEYTYEHISNFYVKNAPSSKEDRLLNVDLTGAVFLIDKKIYKKAKFKYSSNGEDSGFCEDIKNMGYDIWCNVGLFSQHIMCKNQLDKIN